MRDNHFKVELTGIRFTFLPEITKVVTKIYIKMKNWKLDNEVQ